MNIKQINPMHFYRIFDSVDVLIKLFTYLWWIKQPVKDKMKQQKRVWVMICSFAACRASTNLAQSFIILIFCCSLFFSNLSLAKAKDYFIDLYLSFLSFRSCHWFTHFKNSILRVESLPPFQAYYNETLLTSFLTDKFYPQVSP